MKKLNTKKMVLIGVVLFLIGMVCGIYVGLKEPKTDAYKFKKEYEALNGKTREKDKQTIRSIKISKNNPMIYSNEDEILEKMEKGETFAVYFGFTDCPWCRSVLPTLLEVAKDLDINQIYYVNVKEIRDIIEYKDGELVKTFEGTKGYNKLLEKLDELLKPYVVKDAEQNEIETGEKRIFAPNILSVINGKPEKLTVGKSSLQTDGYMELTDEMKKEMYNEIKCTLKCVKENQAVCESAC